MSYPIPKDTVETLYEIKKSKFIAQASYAADREQAMAVLKAVKARYPDARHHCWAYTLGSPSSPTSAAMSDDGEPSGTAGKPILNVLQHKDVGDIIIVVTRYFGGIKLGAGGLVRAYSAAAQQAIDELTVEQQVDLFTLQVTSDFKHEQFVRHLVTQHNGDINNVAYSENVSMTIALPAPAIDDVIASCENIGVKIQQTI